MKRPEGVQGRLSSLLVETVCDLWVQARYPVTVLIVLAESHVELDVGEYELGVVDRNAEIGAALAVESGECVDRSASEVLPVTDDATMSEQISVDSWYRRTPFGVNADVEMPGVWCLVTSRPYSARCR